MDEVTDGLREGSVAALEVGGVEGVMFWQAAQAREPFAVATVGEIVRQAGAAGDTAEKAGWHNAGWDVVFRFFAGGQGCDEGGVYPEMVEDFDDAAELAGGGVDNAVLPEGVIEAAGTGVLRWWRGPQRLVANPEDYVRLGPGQEGIRPLPETPSRHGPRVPAWLRGLFGQGSGWASPLVRG